MKLRVLACLLLLIAVPPIPGQAPDQPANEGKNPKSATRKQQNPAQAVTPASAENPIASPISQDGGAKQKEKNNPVSISTVKPLDVRADVPKDWMDKLNWVLAVALVLIGIFGVLYARKTLKAIEGQLAEIRAAGKQTDAMLEHAGTQAQAAKLSAEAAKLSTEVLINSERAWVLVSKVWAPDIGPPLGGRINEFLFNLENRGKTVARLTGPYKVKFRLLAAGDRLPDIPDYEISNRSLLDAPESPIHGRIMAPGQIDERISAQYWDVQITIGVFESIQKLEGRLYFYASLKYFDFAEKERELQFCYVYVPATKGQPARWDISGPKEYNKHT